MSKSNNILKPTTFWLQALNVRNDEAGIVKKLFFLQFFQGAGIAFFLTSSITLLLEKFSISQIPYVFIVASALLWISGFVYSRLEHRLPLNRVSLIITVFMIVSVLFFRLAFELGVNRVFIFFMLPWFYVLYLLNNLEFWGVASLIFDARQSKRLFGVISAGDIPAKLIGYSLAGLIVGYVGTVNLLWAGLACLLASLPFLINGNEAKVLQEHHQQQHHKHIHSDKRLRPEHNVKKIIENYSGNALIYKLALLGLMMTVIFLVINFSFWTKVKQSFHDDVELAYFIAFFNAIFSVIFMFVKLVFTSRLINRIGIFRSLLITPLVLLTMVLIDIFSDGISNQKVLLYCFGATYSIVDILKNSINNPVFLTIMQPLPNQERLRAHMILKGIVDPFAYLLSGLILLWMFQLKGEIDLALNSYFVLGICLFWIIGVYTVKKQYLKTVIKSISSKFFNLENLSVHDTDTLAWLKTKVRTGTETEVLNIISMLSNAGQLSDELMFVLLENHSEKVKMVLLNIMLDGHYPMSAKSLLTLNKEDVPPGLLAKSIKVICKHNLQPDHFLEFLTADNEEIRHATIDGLYFYSEGNDKQIAGEKLRELMLSNSIPDRIAAAQILSNHICQNEDDSILLLMNDNEQEVRKNAFIAAGKTSKPNLIKALIESGIRYELEMIEPLYFAGEPAIPYILKHIMHGHPSPLQTEKLILLLGRFNIKKSHDALLELLQNKPAYFHITTKALYRSNFKADAQATEPLINFSRQLLSRCAAIIYLQNSLIGAADTDLLHKALQLELEALRESILLLFAVIYNRNNINKVRNAYETGDKSSIVNAMEIIDISVRKDIAYRFNIIFEPGNIHDRLHDLAKAYAPVTYDDITDSIESILGEDAGWFNNWTISCALYTAKKHQIHLKESILQSFSGSSNQLLRETASYAKG